MTRLSVLILIIVLNVNKNAAQVPTSDLVSKWEFTGNANDPVSNNNGVVHGATLTADRFGNCNSAYSFDGINDYITMPNGGVTGTVSRSLCFWAKTSKTAIQTAFGYGSIGSGALYQVLFNHSCQGVGFDVSNAMLMRGVPSQMLNNAWHHYAVIIDVNVGTMMSNMIFYVDGAIVSNTLCGSNSNINTGTGLPIQIGKDPNALARWFKGSLDDFYFYDRALSASEVQAIYNDQSTNTSSSPISGSTLVCSGSSNIYSVAPTGTLSWNVGPGWNGNSTTNTINISAGTGTAQLTVISGDCTLSALTLSAVPLPEISAGSSNSVICQGETAVLTATGGVSYTWQPGSSNSQSLTVFPPSNTVYTVSASGPNGCINTTTVVQNVSICTGVKESSFHELKVVAYPNPAQSYFYLTMSEGNSAGCVLYDTFGRAVKEIEVTQVAQKVSTEGLADGIYVLKSRVPGNSIGLKIIVNNSGN